MNNIKMALLGFYHLFGICDQYPALATMPIQMGIYLYIQGAVCLFVCASSKNSRTGRVIVSKFSG